MIGIYLFVSFRTKALIKSKNKLENLVSKRTEEVEVQKNILAEKNKDITDSINYAKRIQQSILVEESDYKNEFSDAFIIYLPKDIVSGDYYWMQTVRTSDERNLNLKLVAAVDCTGHGVPGAFMSLISSELLNQSLKNPNINSPGELLVHINNKLPETLNKKNNEKIQDGLDIAVCAVDMNNDCVYYSGANRPLWIYKKETSELMEIQPTKSSIGGTGLGDVAFETHKIPLIKGDRLYLFSDGYADQFGGPKNKKLGTKGLRKLITSNSLDKLAEQKKQLSSFYNNWKGTNEQVDDVLLMCIEY